MKILTPLENFSQIQKRISKVAANAPAAKLKGLGNVRHEMHMPFVFARLEKLAPNHCQVVTSRQAINGYGKLGFVGHNYVSPELQAVIEANAEDFKKLDSAMSLVAKINL